MKLRLGELGHFPWPRGLDRWAGGLVLVGAIVVLAPAVDTSILASTWNAARAEPLGIALALVAYALAFLLRSVAWASLVSGLSFGHSVAALHLSLGANHVLPFRLGEAVRVTSVVRRAGIPVGVAASSTVALRAADLVAVLGLAALLGPRVAEDLLGGWAWPAAALAATAGLAGLLWLRRIDGLGSKRPALPLIALSAAPAWVLESVVLWQSARWAGLGVGFDDAVLVTAVTIAAQTVAIAPGGLGTYEAAATVAFVSVGAEAGPALAAAVAAHALKTLYALVTGGIALFIPAPGIVGRLRLPAGAPRATAPVAPARDAVLLFLPAHNEQDSVAAVVERVPESVLGHPVECLVVDDGSTDGTVERAKRAGAGVLSLKEHRGLGAAVRAGLQEAAARGVAAAAFCDADGEYAPEELGCLVAPILNGDADYVVGSRFSGEIRRMLPHRRLGNRLLTRGLATLTRTNISDGQSGYRALAPAAVADAEIIHDYNYAQVLTLDLLGKGYRYAEVPIGYEFRSSGSSFVRPASYLRRVVPAVHRELNTARPGPPVRPENTKEV